MGLVKLYTARDAMEAHYLRGVLEAEGIRATVLGEMLGAARGELPMTPQTLPAVWVDPQDLPRAAALAEAFSRSGPAQRREAGPPWTCPRCGERIEGQFDACWKCGEPRPE